MGLEKDSGGHPAKNPDSLKLSAEAQHPSQFGEEWNILFNAVSDAVCLLDKNHIIRRCNSAMMTLFRLPEDRIIGRHCWEVVHGTNANYEGCPVLAMEKSLRRESQDMQIGGKWFQVTVDPILDESGALSQTVHIVRDITGQKTAELELRDTAARFRAMIDTAPYGAHLYELMPDGRLVFTGANKSADVILGIHNALFVGKTIEEAFPNLVQTDIPGAYRQVAVTGITYNAEQIAYSDDQGISGAFEVSAFQTAPNKIAVLFRDITEKKRAEEALRQSETRFHELVETLPLGVFEADPRGNITFFNSMAIKWLGYDYSEIISGLNAADLVIEADRQRVVANMRKSIDLQAPVANEYVARKKSGESFPVMVMSRPIYRNGAISGIRGIVIDIADRKKAEQEMYLERERLAVTLRSIGDGVITTDTRGRINFLNSVAENMTGWNNADAFGKPLAEVFHIVNEFTRKPCENPVEKVLQTGIIVELANHTLLISRDGREMVLADSGSPIKDEKGNIFGVVLVFRDVTEKQKMLDTMQQTQKLDSLGILAGGIAHDFNNLLGGIFGYIDLALMNHNLDETATDYLNKAMSVLTRAKNLTQQLLTFAKGGAPVRKSGSVAKTVKECSLFALSGSNVKCHFSEDDDLFLCEFDNNQICQVIDNIVLNAQQAMPMGGSIEVSVRNFHIQAGQHRILHEGEYIKISVKDTGVGIPKEIMSRIFDPFFTTKTRGHGLGLATAYSIIRKHDGCIDVESEPGKGASFHVYLPASRLAAEQAIQEVSEQSPGSGRILVMDDEEFIRDTVSLILSNLGYDPISVKDGAEALSRFSLDQANGLKFAAIILDLTIPGGVGGKEVVARIRESDLKVPVIAVSGYSEDPAIANPRDFGFSGSITKPFTVKEIGKLLKNISKK